MFGCFWNFKAAISSIFLAGEGNLSRYISSFSCFARLRCRISSEANILQPLSNLAAIFRWSRLQVPSRGEYCTESFSARRKMAVRSFGVGSSRPFSKSARTVLMAAAAWLAVISRRKTFNRIAFGISSPWTGEMAKGAHYSWSVASAKSESDSAT